MQALWCDHDPSDVTITNYVKSENRDLDLLIDYVDRLDNGGVFKRMGFLLERLVPEGQGGDFCKHCVATALACCAGSNN